MINLMLCGNDKVFDGMLITLLSISKHTDEALNVYLMTMDLREEDPRFKKIEEKHRKTIEDVLKKKNKESKVTIIDQTELYKSEFPKNSNKKTHYTPYIFLRLLSDKVKELPEKILYLDCDLVAYQDIKELYDIDMSDAEVAMAKDYIGKLWINTDYRNSGVVLMNLKNIRKSKCFDKARKLCMTRRMMLPDQTALNIACKKNILLDERYNEQNKRKDETVIQHFSMKLIYFPFPHPLNVKPWQIDDVHDKLKMHDFDDIYEEFKVIKANFIKKYEKKSEK